ncbi:MAG: hypothetical protein WCK67_05715 [bacterium]
MELAENLRNKYQDHCVVKPLIQYCDENNLEFEMMKETRVINFGLKCFKRVNKYYLFIGKKLVDNDEEVYYWSDLFNLIATAYKILGISYHENLVKAARSFNRVI